MDIALSIIGGLLLLMGLAVCAVNFHIALHRPREGENVSMVPLIGTLFMLLGTALLSRGNEHAPAYAVLVLPFLLLDLSGLPSLLLLPLFLLLRSLRGADAPPLLPFAAKRVLLIAYAAGVGFLAACMLVGLGAG